jgi:hypothetical protein
VILKVTKIIDPICAELVGLKTLGLVTVFKNVFILDLVD